ncbi:hypothetical protein [Cellulomonas iranensis]|uniref:hypothetical protein n=1 Tax=Cellulomonas iranensis TaxID=76862 RepID=UPI003D7CB560
MGRVLDRIDDVQRQTNDAASSLLRSAGIRVQPARITSTNYDGTDHTDLGTTGWSLGADEPGGETYFVLDGVDVYASLQQQVADLATVVAGLTQQQVYLSSLVSRDAALGTFNSGVVPPDSTYRWVGDELVIDDVVCTTGKLRVSTFVNHLTASGSGVIAAGLAYAVDGVHTLTAGARSCGLYSANANIGASLGRVGHVEVEPGTVLTIRARAYTWSPSGAASANFEQPRMLVEVVNND